jgi:hypothetical protein
MVFGCHRVFEFNFVQDFPIGKLEMKPGFMPFSTFILESALGIPARHPRRAQDCPAQRSEIRGEECALDLRVGVAKWQGTSPIPRVQPIHSGPLMGDYLAFFADGKPKKLEISGGPVQIICDAPSGRGGTWNKKEVIFSRQTRGPGKASIGVCPTGALMFKSEYDMRQGGTWDESRQTQTDTVWPYCGVGCNLTVHQQEGQIVRVTSPLDKSVTHGNLCLKGRFGWQFVQIQPSGKQKSNFSADAPQQ